MQKRSIQLLSATLLTGMAFAQGPDVAIVAAAHSNLTNCRYLDVQSYLQASGSFNSVDIIDCVSQLITLADLMPYDAVLTFSNFDYFDPINVGDTLADYADTGGGVLTTLFANTSTMPNQRLRGRWITGGYEIIEPGLDHQFNTASLGMILDPTHPSVQGVTALTGQVAFRPEVSTGLLQGTVIAQWDDGAILAAQGDMPNRIDLGLYPPSSDCNAIFWDSAGDGDLLVINSLLAVANPGAPGGIGTGYCTAVPNQTGVPGLLAALGSVDVASNDVTLSASSLPASSFAFFITSQMQGFVTNPGGSAGNLCVAGSIGRYVGPGQIQQVNADGRVELALDLNMTPQPTGPVAVQPGESWNFQTWYRDFAGGMATSNFTNGYTITFN